MELKKSYSVSALRTLTMYIQLYHETHEVSKDLLSKALSDIQSESTSISAINLLLSNGIIKTSNGCLHPEFNINDFNWLNYLLDREQSAMVLGLPGAHTIVLTEELEKKSVLYIDHDVAWRSLLNNSERTLDIISPFIDPEGIDLFANDLLRALKKRIPVRIITRRFDPGLTSQKRSAIERLVNKVKSEYRASDLCFGYFHDGNCTEEKMNHLGSVHAKMLIQDNKIAYVGSGEFRKNSAYMNLEIGFVRTDPLEISRLATVFEIFWGLCDVREWSEAL